MSGGAEVEGALSQQHWHIHLSQEVCLLSHSRNLTAWNSVQQIYVIHCWTPQDEDKRRRCTLLSISRDDQILQDKDEKKEAFKSSKD